ncbi:ParB/RepB/Spo0J family partition protein [Tissierella creatinini]|nr:ParB/RepB/Spo0J family partition protein [Tissierella creatinini]TJX61909.1 ParB/RepB/Spo0J family partition protein [Soehngenia saccharolytica]
MIDLAIKKTGLGKGLSALISDKAVVENLLSEEDKHDKIEHIAISLIEPKKDQPRQYFDDESLKDLATSIEKNGLIQPIILRKKGETYEIVAGERRWRAAKSINIKEIPAIVRDIDEEGAAKISLIENIQRENLNPIEEATAYRKLMEDYELKQDELGEAIGKSRVYISNSIRLLNLDERVVQFLYEGKLTAGHGKVLLGIEDKEDQYNAAVRIINLGLNVRETEAEVKEAKGRPKKKMFKAKKPYLQEIEDNLMSSLGTKVYLNPGRKKGKIEIEYYGDEDLERLIDLLTK